MRKFLMAAAVLAVAACGEKAAEEAPVDSSAMAPMDSTMQHDSTATDSTMAKDSAAAPAAQ